MDAFCTLIVQNALFTFQERGLHAADRRQSLHQHCIRPLGKTTVDTCWPMSPWSFQSAAAAAESAAVAR